MGFDSVLWCEEGNVVAMPAGHLTWTVALIGGSSGVGKSTTAEQVGLRFGVPWLQLDDVRLALQSSRVTLPERTEALYFFEETPNVWRLPPERLRDGLIALSDVLSVAVEAVVEKHVTSAAPVLIEGDSIVPSMLTRRSLRDAVHDKRVRPIFVIESEEEAIRASLEARGQEHATPTDTELRVEARAKWLHGQWLATEARDRGLAVLEARPWQTLALRIEAYLSS